MSEDPYEVNVLTFRNPHQLWVQPLRPTAAGEMAALEQVGLYGAVGQRPELDASYSQFVMQSSARWCPAAITELRRFLEAPTIMFKPVLVLRDCSIFDDNIYKFGEISARDHSGNVTTLSDHLKDAKLAMINKQLFLDYVEYNRLSIKLSTFEVSVVIGELIKKNGSTPSDQWKRTVERQTKVFSAMKALEAHVSQKSGVRESEKTMKIKDKDFEQCKGANYKYIGVKRPVRSIQRANAAQRLRIIEGLLEKMKIKASTEAKGADDKPTQAVKQPPTVTTATYDGGPVKQTSTLPRDHVDKIGKTELRNSYKKEVYQTPWQNNENDNDSVNSDYFNPNLGEDSFLDDKPTNSAQSKVPFLNIDEFLILNPTIEIAETSISSDFSPKSSSVEMPAEDSSESTNSLSQGRFKLLRRPKQTNEASEQTSSTSSNKHIEANKKETRKFIKEIQPPKHLIEEIYTEPSLPVLEKRSPKIVIKEIINIKQKKPKTPESDDLDAPIPESAFPKKNLLKEVDLTSYKPREEYRANPFDYKPTFIENIITPKLMVHSNNKFRIKPVTELKNIHFSDSIHSRLIEIGIQTPMTLQTLSWPAILRGHSFFMVNPRNSGKTMGYIPAVCRHVADIKEVDNSGPIAIIVCDTTKSVVEVAKLCHTFLQGRKAVLSFYAGIDVNEFVKNLLNGCDILVSTPFFLCKLFVLGTFSVDLSYLSIVVLDGCDRIDELYYGDIQIFYGQIKKMLKTRVNKHHQIQYIAAASRWCKLMQKLSEKLQNVAVCIGSYQECAVYSNVHTSVILDLEGFKVDKVMEFCKQIDTLKRTVIVCNTDDEIKELKKALEDEKYIVLAGGTKLSIQEIYNLNQSWTLYDVPCVAPVLVCCDENLRFMNITNSHYLVHFSLPNTFTAFCKRFAVLIDNYKSIFEDGDNLVKIMILADSDNTEQLPKLLNFMKRCTDNIPDELNRISDTILVEKDKIKAKMFYPICDNLLALGECHNFWYCEKRHTFFPTCDTPVEWMPTNGMITFKILHYHSPIHYSAVLTSHIVNGKRTEIPSLLTRIAMKLNLHFLKEKNRNLHGVPELGDICAVMTTRNSFDRCQVVKILKHYDNGKPKVVLIRLIDEEREKVVTDDELYHLPKQLKEMVSHVVQVRLANIRPQDMDVTFSDLAKDSVARKIKQEGNMYLRAKIALVVGNTIIVDKMEACQDIATTSDTVCWCKVKEFLCEKHAEPNDEHLSKLYSLCKDGGIAFPTEEMKVVPQKEDKPAFKPQWAHFESDDITQVHFCSAESPGTFYVRLKKFEDILNNLCKDIQKYIENNKDHVSAYFGQGDYVLAKYPDDLLYHRARIDYMPAKNSKEKPNCFFVDEGGWRYVGRGDLVVLPETLATVLPFQAIECRLVGIQPACHEWTEWSTNYFCKLCFDKDLKEVYVKSSVKEKAEHTGGQKYGIVVIGGNRNEEVTINHLMCDANLAALLKEEEHYLEWTRQTDERGTDSNSSIVDHMMVPIEEEENYSELHKSKTDERTADSKSSIVDTNMAAHLKEDTHKAKTDKESDSELSVIGKVNTTTSIEEVMHSSELGANNNEDVDSDSIIDEEWKREAEPYKGKVFEAPRKSHYVDPYAFEEDDDDPMKDFDVVNDHLFAKLLSQQEPSISVNLPALPPASDGSKSATPNSNESKNMSTCGLISNCSSYEMITNPEIKELDSDDSVCENKTKIHEIEESKTNLSDNSASNDGHNNSACKSTKASQSAYTAISDSDNVGKRRPRLHWHQTKTNLSVKIAIAEVEKYNLHIRSNGMSFECHAHDTDYAFNVDFYGAVVPEKCSHTSKGLYVLVRLEKLMKMDWKTLTRDCEKKRWIAYDPDALGEDSSEEEDDTKELNEFKQFVEEKRKNDLEEAEDSDDEWDVDL